MEFESFKSFQYPWCYEFLKLGTFFWLTWYNVTFLNHFSLDFYELDADYSNAPSKSSYSWRYKDTIGEALESCRYQFGLEHAFQRYQKQMHLSDKENSSTALVGGINDIKYNIANAAERQADCNTITEGQQNGNLYSGVGVNSVPVIVHGGAKQVTSNQNTRNSHFVYNPMPIRRKSSKKHVPHENKDTRYWTQRIKNNVAARRSRESRRRKEMEVMKRCKSLHDENETLRRENLHLQEKVLSLENLMFVFKKDLSKAIYMK